MSYTIGIDEKERRNGAGGGCAHEELEDEVVEEGADPVAACHALGHSEENEKVRSQRVQRSAADARACDSRFVCQACHLQLMPRALFPVSHERSDHECTSRGESDAPKEGSWRVD